MPRDTLLETKESVVTVRMVTVGLMATAAMFFAIPASNPAQADAAGTHCTCVPAKARPVVYHRAIRRAAHRRTGQAYAEGFYDYWSAAPVRTAGWHGEWRQAPNDWIAPAAYAGGYEEGAYQDGGAYGPPPGYYGPPPGYGEEPGLHIDRGGWSGGVGNFDAGGGGGGGMGQAIIAQGGGGLNGPTYNDTNQSFQYNPAQAAMSQARANLMRSGSGSGSQ